MLELKVRNCTNKTNNLSSRGSKVCNYTKKNNKTNSQRVLELSCWASKSLQDSLRIGFICFFVQLHTLEPLELKLLVLLV